MKLLLFIPMLLFVIVVNAQNDHSSPVNKTDFQIYLKQPAKEIKLLMYEKDFTPIQGTLSEDRKSIIMKNYDRESKVHVKVLYDDGSVDEFTKSPCFIDPVIS